MSQLCESVMTGVYETCLESDPLTRAAQIMRDRRTPFVAITEVTHRVIGIVTDRDLAIRALAAGLPPDTPIRAIMRREPFVTVMPEDSLDTVRRKMAELHSSRALVTGRHGIVLGVINKADLLRRVNTTPSGNTPAPTMRSGVRRNGATS